MRPRVGVPLVLALAVCGNPLVAAEISGSARVFGGVVDADGNEEDQLDQRLRLNLAQQLSPWLRLELSYGHNEASSSTEGGQSFERRVRTPGLRLFYDRDRFSARLELLDREISGTSEAANLDVESRIASLGWEPVKGPRWSLRYRDQTNVADSAVFGRDNENRDVNLRAVYDRQRWSSRYSYRRFDLENRLTGLGLRQEVHELRGSVGDRYWGDRLSVSTSGWIRDVDQTQSLPEGIELGRVQPPREGLFAVDTSPEVGELQASPGLVDGDSETPVSPRIEIGGANVFRNIGLDLGVARPVTRLEISVDSRSGPLTWNVYHSPDNLTWERVASTLSEFDAARLRYDLRIEEVTNRFFKAVNVTANGFTDVAVTEIRALVDTGQLGRQEANATTYRGDLQVSVNPSDRFSVVIAGGVRNDEDVAAGELSRDLDESHYNALVRFGITENIDVRVSYRFNELNENLEPVLQREEEVRSASVDWEPLETISAVLTATRREESEDGALLRSIDLVRLRALAQLLPGLRLTSDVSRAKVTDPFSGFDQTSSALRLTFQGQPTEQWRLEGSFSRTDYESTGTVNLNRRTSYRLSTTWLATPYLNVSGDWDLAQDDRAETLTQRYLVSWSPGRKLNASLTLLDTDSNQLRQTTTTAAALSYRLNRGFTSWVNLSRSEFEQAGDDRSEIDTARIGFNLFF